MLESKFQEKLMKRLEEAGAFLFKVHGHVMQQSGMPDLQVYHRTWTGHLELKTKRNSCTVLQREVIRSLKRRGTFAHVLRMDGVKVTVEDEDGVVELELYANIGGAELMKSLWALDVP